MSKKLTFNAFKTLHTDDCRHGEESHMQTIGDSDYYLYDEHGLSICRRYGPDGNYETINFTYNQDHFLNTLRKIFAVQK
jgi:hypothetical protein